MNLGSGTIDKFRFRFGEARLKKIMVKPDFEFALYRPLAQSASIHKPSGGTRDHEATASTEP
jgi:hypothetical protein